MSRLIGQSDAVRGLHRQSHHGSALDPINPAAGLPRDRFERIPCAVSRAGRPGPPVESCVRQLPTRVDKLVAAAKDVAESVDGMNHAGTVSLQFVS